jgi:hypothetical protein
MDPNASGRRLTALTVIFFGCLAFVLSTAAAVSAQVRPLVTDQSSLTLPTEIDLASGLWNWTPAGDLLFTDAGRTALFLKPAGRSLARLLQRGQAVPDISHTRVEYIMAQAMNAGGAICTEVLYRTPSTPSEALLLSTGSVFHPLVTSLDIAPKSDGQPFGYLTLVGLNGHGDVAFTAPVVPVGTPYTGQTLFIIPSDGSPQRLAGPGDVVPSAGGATITAIAAATLNDAGEVLFRATLSSGGYAYLAASVAGDLRKIVAHGDAAPGGGTIDFSTTAPTALANNAGQVAFRDASNKVYIHTAASGLVDAFGAGTAAPAPLATRTFTTITLQAFTDAGELLFTSYLTGTTASNHGLFRFISGNPLAVLAYRGQAITGLTQTVDIVSSAREDGEGNVAFSSSLAPTTPAAAALFVWPHGAGHVEPTVFQGDATTLPGGGTLAAPGNIFLLDGGYVAFNSSITGGKGTFGFFLRTASGLTPAVSDEDTVPNGSLVGFSTNSPVSAGNYVAFRANRAGAREALFVHNAVTGVTQRAVGIGDAAPGGGVLTGVGGNGGVVYVNASGSVVFNGWVSGAGGYVFAWDAVNGVRKLAGPGDVEPTSGNTITYAAVATNYLQPPMNGSGQVVIKASFTGSDYGLYVAAFGQALRKIVRVNSSSPYGDPAPGGGASFVTATRWLINDSGHVAFQGQVRATGGTIYDGMFEQLAAGGALSAIWINNQAAAGTVATLAALAPDGTAIFFAPNAGGATNLYMSVSGGGFTPVATSGAGTPAGGYYAFTSTSMDARVNARGDIVFQAPLTGGPADSAYFMRRASNATIETVAYQGQTSPGMTGVFDTITKGLNPYPGELFALGPTGEICFWVYVVHDPNRVVVLYRRRDNGTLQKIYARSETAPSSGGGVIAGTGNGEGPGPAGLFFMTATVVDGTFSEVLYATRITPSVTWANPASIVAGTALSSTQLNATASVPGSFAYSPAAGTVLSPGAGQTISTTFTPTDTTVYEPVTRTVTIDVTIGVATVTSVTPSYGPPVGKTAVTITGSGFVSGATVTIGGASATSVVVVSSTSITAVTPAHVPGSVSVVVTNPTVGPGTLAQGFRYLPPPAGHDFDGDGRVDIGIYRPSSGTWFWLKSSTGNSDFGYRGWGVQAQNDAPVVGDFDGDGTVDPTVFRPASGTWFVLESHAAFSTWRYFGWGVSTDVPVPGNYESQFAETEPAVFRPSTGTWYVQRPGGGTSWSVVFGQTGDEPIAGDFDGDGVRDVAVYRPSNGTWFWLKSSTGRSEFDYRGWGLSAEGDRPAPGDYDGDGKTDLCVFRPSTGTWFILESHANYTTWSYFGWGVSTDTLVPADYDGDGRTDAAVYRPSTGTWYVRPSNGSTPWSIVFGGQAGDVPLIK